MNQSIVMPDPTIAMLTMDNFLRQRGVNSFNLLPENEKVICVSFGLNDVLGVTIQYFPTTVRVAFIWNYARNTFKPQQIITTHKVLQITGHTPVIHDEHAVFTKGGDVEDFIKSVERRLRIT